MIIVFIGNFLPDKQESMQRFMQSIRQDIEKKGIGTKLWLPPSFFSAFSKTSIAGPGKWLGYLDKWILFPLLLFVRRYFMGYNRKKFLFHICDHSNAPYLKWLPKSRTVITCHDVLAIRGAMGYADAYCPATSTGKILQKWILSNLIKAQYLTTVSSFTMRQLLELKGDKESENPQGWHVIPNSFNGHFWVMKEDEKKGQLSGTGLDDSVPFLLHVGSDLPRKNRKLLVDMLQVLRDKWNGKVCLAGHEPEPELKEYIAEKKLSDRIIIVKKPDHSTLVALYNTCEAFIFPSFSEGFGWPVIEAQACGAPVIASNLMPMPEVGGEAALYADPYIPSTFAEALLFLTAGANRNNLIKKGFQNCKRFENEAITQQYLQLYNIIDKA